MGMIFLLGVIWGLGSFVLKLDCGESYTTLKILKTTEFYTFKQVNFIVWELDFHLKKDRKGLWYKSLFQGTGKKVTQCQFSGAVAFEEFQLSAPLPVAISATGFLATIVTKLLVFKAPVTLGGGSWEQGRGPCHRVHCSY